MFNRVLLVDDSKSARFALRKLLENNGLEVDLVANAEEALGYLDQNHPDLIFMDHFMPGMDGFEAAQAIKGKPATAAIPIVMCTSKDDADYIEQAKAHGAVDILPKPATPDALSDVLDKLANAVEAIQSQQPVNDSEFGEQSETEMVEISEAEPLLDTVPTLDEVVVPMEDVRDVAQKVAHQVAEQLVAERVASALQDKVPELREMVMQNFDAVVKSMISGYLEEAKQQAKEDFSALLEVEARKTAEQVSAAALDTAVKAQVLVTQEKLQKELNEQFSEIYSSIGELKSNQQMKKIAPELMEDILERAGDIAIEKSNESLLKASDIAQQSAKSEAKELTEKAMGAMRDEMQEKISRSLESGFESARQEAAEIAWEKVAEEKAVLLGAIDKLKDRASLALGTGLIALIGVAYQLFV